MFDSIDIRSIRKERNLTQTQLGILCGMGKSQVSRMERGLLGSPETISRILDAMGYDAVVSVIKREASSFDITTNLASYKRYNAEKYGIESLGLFGSYARGEQTPESDIYVIIKLTKPSLYKYAEIKEDLERLFKKEVDIVSLSSRMSDEFKMQLEKDAVYV